MPQSGSTSAPVVHDLVGENEALRLRLAEAQRDHEDELQALRAELATARSSSPEHGLSVYPWPEQLAHTPYALAKEAETLCRHLCERHAGLQVQPGGLGGVRARLDDEYSSMSHAHTR